MFVWNNREFGFLFVIMDVFYSSSAGRFVALGSAFLPLILYCP
nr:MAG TPA: hypothetical protein [Bacteriophage sp.]